MKAEPAKAAAPAAAAPAAASAKADTAKADTAKDSARHAQGQSRRRDKTAKREGRGRQGGEGSKKEADKAAADKSAKAKAPADKAPADKATTDKAAADKAAADKAARRQGKEAVASFRTSRMNKGPAKWRGSRLCDPREHVRRNAAPVLDAVPMAARIQCPSSHAQPVFAIAYPTRRGSDDTPNPMYPDARIHRRQHSARPPAAVAR